MLNVQQTKSPVEKTTEIENPILHNYDYSKDTIKTSELKYKFEILDIKSFLNYQLSKKEYLFNNLIEHPSLIMIYADAGTGKTFVALSLALSLSSGETVLNMKSNKPRKILYIDGEMNAGAMQERINKLLAGMSIDINKIQDKFFIYPYGIQPNNTPLDFANPDVRQYFEQTYLPDIDVLIIDNLSSLVTLKENENDEWKDFNKWCANLRSKGITVITIHHTNKSKESRGAICKRDYLDLEIELSKSHNNIIWKYTKHRNLSDDEAKSFAFSINSSDNNIKLELEDMHKISKSNKNTKDYTRPFAKLAFYMNKNYNITYSQLQNITDISDSTLNRLVKQCANENTTDKYAK